MWCVCVPVRVCSGVCVCVRSVSVCRPVPRALAVAGVAVGIICMSLCRLRPDLCSCAPSPFLLEHVDPGVRV